MSRKTIWKKEFVDKVYGLARSGVIESKIASKLGISYPTFMMWKKKKREFCLVLRLGKKEHRSRRSKILDFRSYIYKRLSYDLKHVWNRINKLDRARNGLERLEAFLVREGEDVRQHLFIYAWVTGNFSLSKALQKVNISRGTFNKWSKDPIFIKMVNEIEWHKKNFFEDSLCDLVASGDSSATIFVNKTYNRDRGYNEKVEVNMNLSGEINQNVMSVDVMKLSLRAKKEILESLRKNKKS